MKAGGPARYKPNHSVVKQSENPFSEVGFHKFSPNISLDGLTWNFLLVVAGHTLALHRLQMAQFHLTQLEEPLMWGILFQIDTEL